MLSMLTHLISFNFVAWVILTLLLSMLLTVVYYIFVGVVRWVLPLISHLFFIWLGDIIGSLVCSPSLRLCYTRAILVRICIICNFDPLSLLKYIYNFMERLGEYCFEGIIEVFWLISGILLFCMGGVYVFLYVCILCV